MRAEGIEDEAQHRGDFVTYSLDMLEARLQALVQGMQASPPREFTKAPLAHAFLADGGIDVDVVADAFGISKSQLAETMGIRREVLYKRTRIGAPKTQARLREMLEVLGRVLDWAGSKEQAMAWYRTQPIAALGGRTAESLVKSGEAAAVRDYLDQIAIGGYA